MGVQDDAERIEPESLDDWAGWLEAHHDTSTGVWLVTAKKASGRNALSYEDCVVEALRFGWVDSKAHSLDDTRRMIWYCARKPNSAWARTNKKRIARLEQEGRLEAAGRAAVETAKANGSWTLLDSVEDLIVPDDLDAALDGVPGARTTWDSFAPSLRKGMLAWVVMAKRPETRTKRVAAIAEAAGRGEKAIG